MSTAWIAWLLHWSGVDPDDHMRSVAKDLAWICRYARGVTLTELMDMDRGWLKIFGDELGKIVEIENRPVR